MIICFGLVAGGACLQCNNSFLFIVMRVMLIDMSMLIKILLSTPRCYVVACDAIACCSMISVGCYPWVSTIMNKLQSLKGRDY